MFSFLRRLSRTVDTALALKSKADTLLGAANAHKSVTKPLHEVLDFLNPDHDTATYAEDTPPSEEKR